jgi:tetratricopeptide (TPR) repeat protein
MYPLLDLGRLCLAEGAWEEAAQYLEDFRLAAEQSGDLQALRDVQNALATRDLLAGQPAAARARLLPLLDRPGLEELYVTRLLPTLAWAYLDLGEVAQAADVAVQAVRRARAQRYQFVLVEALRVHALVASAQEHWKEAERSLEEGLVLAQSMPYPYMEGRLLHVYGEMHAQKGEAEPARERLEAALAIFQRLGACNDVERVEQTLSTLQCAPSRDAAGQAMPSLPPRQGGRAGPAAGRRLSRTQRHAWAWEHLRTAGPLSPRAYATALGVSVDTALRDLQELVGRGRVQAAGTTRDRRYVLAADALGPAIHRTGP